MNNNNLVMDALSFEYQRYYGAARNYFDFPDFVDNSFIKSKSSIFSLSFPEKLLCFSISEMGVLDNDVADSFLVA